MDVRSLTGAEPFTTADGSTIRQLFGLAVGSARHQSLAEASLPPGRATTRHEHRESEEIYLVLDGSGELEVDGERRVLAAGDAALIPPGAWHEIRAGADGIRFLCCCSPPYRHEDTYFA